MTFIKEAFKFISTTVLIFIVLIANSGCNQDSPMVAVVKNEVTQGGSDNQAILEQNLPIPNNQNTDQYRIILYGNSHVSGLSGLITDLIKTGKPQSEAEVVVYGGGYLVDSYAKDTAQERLEEGNWTHAIFQAQKYSQSQSVSYPTIAAQKWLDKAKSLGVTPILFPEHAQKGNIAEGDYVLGIHKAIASSQDTCLAPVPLVWKRVLQISPGLPLHHNDGNHAAYLGRFLTSLVFYEVITGQSADLLPYIPSIEVTEEIQTLFGQLVSEVIAMKDPCGSF
ncbi:hypothetical protein [Shewanella frigidimarina]|uniref:hypothetical protein n=1 Tax=Shewanella frigidimarina TaxID=56812 RepID=UPI003D7A3273